MFKHLSIKLRNILLAIMVIVGLLALQITTKYFGDKETKLIALETNIKLLKEDVLILRKHEKDFLMRNDLKYQKSFHEAVVNLQKDIKALEIEAKAHAIEAKELNEFASVITQYQTTFDDVVKEKVTIGLTHKEGLEGKMRQAIHEAETFFKEIKDYKMQTLMLTLRRNEKDFMLRLDPTYNEHHAKNYEKAVAYIQSTQGSEADLTRALPLMTNYRQSFVEYVKAYDVLGMNEKSGLTGKLRSIVHQTEEILTRFDTTLYTIIQAYVKQTTMLYYIIIASVITLVLTFIFFIIRSITTPLHALTRAIVSNERDLTVP
jgi:methyl-accepting chemotaxis protein